jgi:hypothetical protein
LIIFAWADFKLIIFLPLPPEEETPWPGLFSPYVQSDAEKVTRLVKFDRNVVHGPAVASLEK